MDKKQMEREQQETIELFAERIDDATPCGQKPEHRTGKEAEKAGEAVTSTAERTRKIAGKKQ